MSETSSALYNRHYYLDWLRFIIVLSLTPFHAAISFTGMGSVYVYDKPVRDILLSGGTPFGVGPLALIEFTVFMDNWFMHLLFLISGISSGISLRRRNGNQYILERCNRLLVPLGIGIVFFVSFQSWLRALSFSKFQGSYFSFFLHFFNGVYTNPSGSGNFDWGHLWFLVYLFVFASICLPFFLATQRRDKIPYSYIFATKFSKMPFFLVPAIWIALLEVVFRPGWPGCQNLFNDWANFTVYISFFVFGYIIINTEELLHSIYKYRLQTLLIGIFAFLARIGMYSIFTVSEGYNSINMIAQGFRGIAAYGLVMAAMGYGEELLNKPGKLLQIAQNTSFPLYIVHYAPLSAITYLLLDTGLSIWARWLIAITLTWLFVIIFTFAAQFTSPTRYIFGIKRLNHMTEKNN